MPLPIAHGVTAALSAPFMSAPCALTYSDSLTCFTRTCWQLSQQLHDQGLKGLSLSSSSTGNSMRPYHTSPGAETNESARQCDTYALLHVKRSP